MQTHRSCSPGISVQLRVVPCPRYREMPFLKPRGAPKIVHLPSIDFPEHSEFRIEEGAKSSTNRKSKSCGRLSAINHSPNDHQWLVYTNFLGNFISLVRNVGHWGIIYKYPKMSIIHHPSNPHSLRFAQQRVLKTAGPHQFPQQ